MLEDYLLFKWSQGLKEGMLKDMRQKVSQFFRTYPNAWPIGIIRAAQRMARRDRAQRFGRRGGGTAVNGRRRRG